MSKHKLEAANQYLALFADRAFNIVPQGEAAQDLQFKVRDIFNELTRVFEQFEKEMNEEINSTERPKREHLP